MYKVAIFDMDGTILNTLEDLTISTNYALENMGKRHHFPPELVKLCYGCAIDADMEKALAMEAGCPGDDLEYIGNQIPLEKYGFGEKEVQQLKSIFTAYYSTHCQLHSCPYEGIPQVLTALRDQGIHTAVASNKDDADVQSLAAAQFPGLFDVTIGNSPAVRRKPDPDMLLNVLDRLHLTPKDAIYIGDSEVDIETAKRGGMPCISVTWGFRTKDFLLRHGASCVVETAKELEKQLGIGKLSRDGKM